MSNDGLELAPAVTVRVAGWPLASVTCFGRSGPGPLARDSGLPEGYVEAHRAAIEQERALLWERTVADPRFMRALAVANPELARGLLGKRLPEVRNKSARHLETTLYRYLARAACRSQPGDMWATATLASWGPRRAIEPRRARCLVAPDLAAFRTIVDALAARSPYREGRAYKLNPTLTRQDDGSYLLWSAPGARPSVQRRLAASAQVEGILATLGAAFTWTRTAAAEAVAAGQNVRLESARRAIDRLCEQGVLVGGLALPRRFTDAWQALEQVEAELEAEHARAWRSTRSTLARLAAELGEVIQTCDPATVIASMDAGRAELLALAQALEVQPFVPPRAAFRCDFEAPWSIELGPEDARALERTIDSYTRHERADGMHRPLVDAAIARALAGAGGLGAIVPAPAVSSPGGVVSWDAVLAAHDPSSEPRRRCDRRERQLGELGPEVRVPSVASHGIGEARLAALHCSLAPAALGGGVVVHGVALDATAAHARFAALLEPGSKGVLAAWFIRAHQRLREHTGSESVALIYDHATPNVLAQPELWSAFLDLWGITPDQLSDRGVRLVQRGARLGVAVDGRLATVFLPTAANPRVDDPCLQALLLSSRHAPPLTVDGARVVHASELELGRHRPRLRLEDGAVIQPRRTLVTGEALERLLSVRGAARFAAWSELALRHEWPELVLLDGGLQSPLAVRRDSPLAIEAAFEGAQGMRALIVEELIRSAWVGQGDELHVADLVVPYFAAEATP